MPISKNFWNLEILEDFSLWLKGVKWMFLHVIQNWKRFSKVTLILNGKHTFVYGDKIYTKKILQFTSIKEIYWSLWETKRLVDFWGEQRNFYTLEYQCFLQLLSNVSLILAISFIPSHLDGKLNFVLGHGTLSCKWHVGVKINRVEFVFYINDHFSCLLTFFLKIHLKTTK